MDQVRQALLSDDAEVDGSGVLVAVIDTGVDVEHPDIKDRVDRIRSRGFGISAAIADRHGHGTHVAGIIAGNGRASEGKLRGVAPGVDLLVLKVSEDLSGSSHDVAAAVEVAVDCGADIINYSGGASGHSMGPPPWKWPTRLSVRDRAFVAASRCGILCVAAAGNEGPEEGTVIRPGNLEEVLCVGATELPDNLVASQSGRGPVYLDSTIRGPARADSEFDLPSNLCKPDVMAPGGDGLPLGTIAQDLLGGMGVAVSGVTSARARTGRRLGIEPQDPDCLYTRMAGTSQATAAVTGLAALLLSLGRKYNADWGPNTGAALRELLRRSAIPLKAGSRMDFGWGVLLWPQIVGALSDFISDDRFREVVLRGPQLRIM